MDFITISGPPSSGKTSVIIKTIENFLKKGIKVGSISKASAAKFQATQQQYSNIIPPPLCPY